MIPDQEKLIRALAFCCYDIHDGDCNPDCPYYDACSVGSPVPAVMYDVLALLKGQEARVMKPEEIPDYDGAIYLEDFGEPEIVIAVYDRGVARRVKFAIRGTRSTIAGYDDYNKRWRAWTSRPTEKQRLNTPWEAADDGTCGAE